MVNISLMAVCVRSFQLSSRLCVLIPARMNSNRSSVARCGRPRYERLYPTVLVHPDGSTVHIRHPEPRRILTIPVDPSSLSEEERRARQKKKRDMMKTKTETASGYDDDFQADNYRHLWRKK